MVVLVHFVFSCFVKMLKLDVLNISVDTHLLKYLLTVNAKPSRVSADDGSSHSQASLEAASIIEAHTVWRYHHKNINNSENLYNILFSTHKS